MLGNGLKLKLKVGKEWHVQQLSTVKKDRANVLITPTVPDHGQIAL